MAGVDGALARRLDFGETPDAVTSTDRGRRTCLRLAPRLRRLGGPDKYRILDARRRRAQIAARHQLALGEGDE